MQPSLAFTNFLTLVTLVSVAIASPAGVYIPTSDLDVLAKLMPMSSLPLPDGLKLKYVLLGIGTQNYTCTGDENDTPGTTGAVAQLFDIGTCLKNTYLAKRAISFISPFALFLSSQPRPFGQSLHFQAPIHLLGHHFFDANTPVFALDQLDQVPYPIAIVQKLNETDAPTPFHSSAQTETDIKWLFLRDLSGVSQGGIDTVYRIETAGGNKPATCKGQKKNFRVNYVAQYWIFGPNVLGLIADNAVGVGEN